MKIGMRQDYSYLFSGMNKKNSSSGSDMSWLGDYSSIKNGSYGKLMKAYYSETGTSAVGKLAKDSVDKTKSEQKETKAELSKVQSEADSLKKSADVLLAKGKDSVFEKEDKNAVYDAVSSFVKDYNSAVKVAGSVSDRNVTGRLNGMSGNTGIYTKQLESIGIRIGDDKTLSIDKDAFEKADLNKVKKLFSGNGSFAYQTSVQASMLSSSAEKAVSTTGLYSANGMQQYSTGNLFNNFM